MFGINTKYKETVAFGKYLPSIKEAGQMTLTFVLTVIGLIIFRAGSMTEACEFISRMFLTLFDSFNVQYGMETLPYGLALLVIEWLQRDKQHALQFDGCKPFRYRLVRWAAYYALLVLIMQNIGDEQTFIYFQF